MQTRDDFRALIESSGARYPTIDALRRAGDPRILQHLEAMATMLAMYSAQIEVAQAEPFEKVRDSTVLADAAMRGIVRKSSPARVRVLAKNAGGSAYRLDSGRMLLDAQGRTLRVESPVDVPAGGAAAVEALQLRHREVVHIVSGSRPFYAIPVESADDDSTLCGLSVVAEDGEYEHRSRYVNAWPGERIFHLEVDERQQLHVRFGQDGVVGVQPRDGAQISITAYYSLGAVEFRAGSPMVFDEIRSPADALIELSLDEVLFPGEAPLSMSALRELAKYPSVYNENAVFLGEFDFLVRRHFPSLSFLSVWNESAEEEARGPSWENVNTLFVACLSAEGVEPVLEEVLGGPDVQPQRITALSGTQLQIKQKILEADDSYKVAFVTPVRSKVSAAITAIIPTSYDSGSVREQIRVAMLDAFGEKASAAARGRGVPLYQQVYDLLRKQVPALQVGRSDLYVAIDGGGESARPELWRYVAEDTLVVSVQPKHLSAPGWGAGA